MKCEQIITERIKPFDRKINGWLDWLNIHPNEWHPGDTPLWLSLCQMDRCTDTDDLKIKVGFKHRALCLTPKQMYFFLNNNVALESFVPGTLNVLRQYLINYWYLGLWDSWVMQKKKKLYLEVTNKWEEKYHYNLFRWLFLSLSLSAAHHHGNPLTFVRLCDGDE